MRRLKDIAAETGYSIKTVSRAIHDHPDIKPETRAAIMEVVRRHGFTPQWAAQSLRIRKTHTVGFVVPNLVNSFFGQIAMIIDAYFRELHYSTLICFTARSRDNEVESLESLLGRNVDGIVFAPSGRGMDYFKALPLLREKPLVLIDNRCDDMDTWYVLHDNRYGMALLVDHLVSRGHRRIAYIGGPPDEWSAAERLEGYRAALARHGITPDKTLTRGTDWERINSGSDATLDLLRDRRDGVTAILYGNSQLLLGGYRALHGLGLRMPADIAVAGFDAPYVIDSLVPRPTTLATVEEKIGLAAAGLLHDLIQEKTPISDREIRIRSELRTGESSG